MNMYKINAGQKIAIEKQPFARNQFYKPIQDINGDWFISEIEIEYAVKNRGWAKAILADYVAPTEII